MGKRKKSSVVSFILGLVGLWPIVFFVVFVLLLVYAGERSAEFSLEPKSTQANRLVLVVAMAASLAVQLTAVVLGIIGRRRTAKGDPGRGLALSAIITGSVGFLFVAAVFSLFLVLSSQFSRDDGELSAGERVVKCMNNQKNIGTALGPDMWGFDHPDMVSEEIAEIDLSPEGDLINNVAGIAYINQGSLDCPEDDDPGDTDYAVVVNPDGTISVECVDEKGVAAGHND